MPLLPREGSAARQRVLAQRLRLQVRLERTAEGQLARELRTTLGQFGQLTDAEVQTALAAHARRMNVLLTTVWRVAMHSSGEQVFLDSEELRKASPAPTERKARNAEQRFTRSVADWIERFGGKRITDVTERTRKATVETLAAGRGRNDSIDQIRRALEADPGFSRARAAVIARTEVHTAGSAASDLAAEAVAQETGVALRREWISAEDDRTRSAHADADGQVRAFGESFEFDDPSIGKYTLMHPGDPTGPAGGTINCRCALGYLPA